MNDSTTESPFNANGTYRPYSPEEENAIRQKIVDSRNSLFIPFLRLFATLDEARKQASCPKKNS